MSDLIATLICLLVERKSDERKSFSLIDCLDTVLATTSSFNEPSDGKRRSSRKTFLKTRLFPSLGRRRCVERTIKRRLLEVQRRSRRWFYRYSSIVRGPTARWKESIATGLWTTYRRAASGRYVVDPSILRFSSKCFLGKDRLDFDDFSKILDEDWTSLHNDRSALRQALERFDVDKKGYLDAEELRNAMRTHGEPLSDAEIDELLELGSNEDGRIEIDCKFPRDGDDETGEQSIYLRSSRAIDGRQCRISACFIS